MVVPEMRRYGKPVVQDRMVIARQLQVDPNGFRDVRIVLCDEDSVLSHALSFATGFHQHFITYRAGKKARDVIILLSLQKEGVKKRPAA